jgi:hypothetical protein
MSEEPANARMSEDVRRAHREFCRLAIEIEVESDECAIIGRRAMLTREDQYLRRAD